MRASRPTDYHLHSNTTEDSVATVEELARAAAERGFAEIAVTDHFILGYDNYRVTVKQLEAHRALADEIGGRLGIKILVGAEVDYFEDRLPEIRAFLDSFDFDIVIGAAHFVDGRGIAAEPGAKALVRDIGRPEAFRRTLLAVERAARSGLFDVMAHLDVIRKFSETPEDREPFEGYAAEAERVADALAESGVGFEVNCRGFSHSAGGQYPSGEFLSLLKSRGIETVTVGSDAHTARDAGADIDRGISALRAAGFDRLSRFERRRAMSAPLEEFELKR
jgi:histidinol-phosphatase (PHP family)